MKLFKKIAIAGIALLGATVAGAQTYTGAQGTGWREVAVPVPPSGRVSIQAAGTAKPADHPSVLIQIDDATGLANSPLPQAVKDNLLRDGLGDGPVLVDRDLANALADGTATTKYAAYTTPDSATAYDSGSLAGQPGRATIQRATREGLFCSSGWQPLTASDTFDGNALNLTKNISGGSLNFNGKEKLHATVKVTVEYKRSDWSACLPYAFRLQSVSAVGTMDMTDGRMALTGSMQATVAQDSTDPIILWQKDGYFTIGYLVVWYSVKVPLEMGYKAMVGASGTVDYSSQMAGVVAFNYSCQSHTCTGTTDTSKLTVTNSTPNVGLQADVVVDPYVKVSVKGQLYPIFNTALASAGLGLKFSTPLQLYGYYGNACGDSDFNGTNEMLQTYFVDLQARLSLEASWSLLDHEGSQVVSFGDWATAKLSGALYRVANAEGKTVPLWHKSLYYKDLTPNGYGSIFSPILRLGSSFKDANGNYNYIVHTTMRPCAGLDTNYIVSVQTPTGVAAVQVNGKGGAADTQFTASTPTLSLTPTGVRDDQGRVFAGSGDIAPTMVFMGTGAGTLQYVGISRTAPGNSNDVATITLKNVGTGTITSIARTCSGQSWHVWGSMPAYIVPGGTATIQCQAAASGTYAAPTVSVTSFNTSNSPFTPY